MVGGSQYGEEYGELLDVEAAECKGAATWAIVDFHGCKVMRQCVAG